MVCGPRFGNSYIFNLINTNTSLHNLRHSSDIVALVIEINLEYFDTAGGTADITVHEKCENNSLKEIYKASGGALGGTVVDEAYIQLLVRLVGGPVIQRFRREACYDFLDMLREFEVTKRTVKTGGKNKVNLRIPTKLNEICKEENDEDITEILRSENCPYHGKAKVRGDKLSMDIETIQEIFRGIIQSVEDLVQSILFKPECAEVSAIVMVGGFSECSLLQQAIKAKFEGTRQKVLVPAESGLSVLKGAVIFGHRPTSIGQRVIRYSYGIETEE